MSNMSLSTIKETFRLYTLCAGMYTSLKSNIVMTYDQSNKKQEQHHMDWLR